MLTFELMPRWPANDNWPREVSIWTVGVRVTKSWKRRPLIGRLSIASLPTVAVRIDVDVSTSGEAAETVIVSATPVSCSVWLRVTDAPTVSCAGRSAVAKPASSIDTS